MYGPISCELKTTLVIFLHNIAFWTGLFEFQQVWIGGKLYIVGKIVDQGRQKWNLLSLENKVPQTKSENVGKVLFHKKQRTFLNALNYCENNDINESVYNGSVTNLSGFLKKKWSLYLNSEIRCKEKRGRNRVSRHVPIYAIFAVKYNVFIFRLASLIWRQHPI